MGLVQEVQECLSFLCRNLGFSWQEVAMHSHKSIQTSCCGLEGTWGMKYELSNGGYEWTFCMWPLKRVLHCTNIVWVALINQSDCALFTKSFHRIKLTSRLFSFSPDLKDENVQLRDENQSLKNYIDRLLLGIISTSPEILEVKGESTTRRSRSLLGPLSTDY